MAAVGVSIIWCGVETFGSHSISKFAGFCYENINVLIGVVFWVRGVVYFVSTVLFHEDTTKLQFFIHLFAISFGAFMFGVKIDIEKVLLAIAILSFVCAAAIGSDGGFEYGRYRKSIKVEEPVEDEVEAEAEVELPAEDEAPVEDENETEIIPVIEPEQTQDIMVN